MFPGRPELRVGNFAATLESIAGRLPAALVSREALDHAGRRCVAFPAALTGWMYFECRLSPRASRVDLVLAVDDVGRAIIAGETPGVHFPDHFWDIPHWAHLRSFCREWGRDGSLLSDIVHHIWLEFDFPRTDDHMERGTPVPGLFICLGEVRPSGFCTRRWLSIGREALYQATGRGLPRDWSQMLERSFDHLPTHGYIPYVGMMLQRPGAGIRLCVTGLEDEEIVQYATELGWPGSIRELNDLLSEVKAARADARVPGVALVHFDLCDHVVPVIGLEYGLDRKTQLGGRLLETSFLDHLVDRGLCSSEHRKALGEWPGGMRIHGNQDREAYVLRRVNHIKLVHRPGYRLEVKAYLCAGFRAG